MVATGSATRWASGARTINGTGGYNSYHLRPSFRQGNRSGIGLEMVGFMRGRSAVGSGLRPPLSGDHYDTNDHLQIRPPAGVGVETIRFYERRGLIQQPRKPDGIEFRVYPEEKDGDSWMARTRSPRSFEVSN